MIAPAILCAYLFRGIAGQRFRAYAVTVKVALTGAAAPSCTPRSPGEQLADRHAEFAGFQNAIPGIIHQFHHLRR